MYIGRLDSTVVFIFIYKIPWLYPKGKANDTKPLTRMIFRSISQAISQHVEIPYNPWLIKLLISQSNSWSSKKSTDWWVLIRWNQDDNNQTKPVSATVSRSNYQSLSRYPDWEHERTPDLPIKPTIARSIYQSREIKITPELSSSKYPEQMEIPENEENNTKQVSIDIYQSRSRSISNLPIDIPIGRDPRWANIKQSHQKWISQKARPS